MSKFALCWGEGKRPQESCISIGCLVIDDSDLTFIRSEAELSEHYAPGTAVWVTEDEGATYRKVTMPEKETLGEWIPVKERLPECEVRVLVYSLLDECINVGLRSTDKNEGWSVFPSYTAWYNTRNGVSHWMPLPDPPPGQGDD